MKGERNLSPQRVNFRVFDPAGMEPTQLRRTGFSGPTLVRLLARLTDTDVREHPHPLPNRLSDWLGWADAIALSATLKRAAPAVPAGPRVATEEGERDCAGVREALEGAIASITPPAPRPRRPGEPPRADYMAVPEADFPTYRRRYASLQRTMETRIGQLRARLRTQLAGRTPEMAQLAIVDAAMEQALGAREQVLLEGVPAMLARHFEQLRESAQAQPAESRAAPAAGVNPRNWLDFFCRDMQRVMSAELDIRMQPVEGLLSALRDC